MNKEKSRPLDKEEEVPSGLSVQLVLALSLHPSVGGSRTGAGKEWLCHTGWPYGFEKMI